MNMRQDRFLVLWRLVAIFAGVAIGSFILVYEGPDRDFFRGYVGDVVAVFVIALFFGIWFRRLWAGPIIALVIGVFLEVIQVFLITQGTVSDITFGAVFDGWDIVAHGCGALIAFCVQMFMVKETQNSI